MDYSITFELRSHRRSPDVAVRYTFRFLSCPDMIEEGITPQLSPELTNNIKSTHFLAKGVAVTPDTSS